MKGEVRDEASGLDKRKNQRKRICILFMAVLANKEWWPDDQWGLGVQKKEGKARKKKVRTAFPSPHTRYWLLVSYSWLSQ